MRRRSWALGLGLVGVLLVAYLGAIRPARVAFATHAALPLFEWAAAGADLTLERRGAYVWASGPGVGAAHMAIYKTPLGDRPMLGVLALAVLFPRQRWWLRLAAMAVLEGVLTTVFFAGGAYGLEGSFVAHRVVQAVLNDTLPLAFPALVFLLARTGRLPDADGGSSPTAGR